MSYSFEGNHRTKPEQNLSGASKKLSREVLLQKTHEERRKRQVPWWIYYWVKYIDIILGTKVKITQCPASTITHKELPDSKT